MFPPVEWPISSKTSTLAIGMQSPNSLPGPKYLELSRHAPMPRYQRKPTSPNSWACRGQPVEAAEILSNKTRFRALLEQLGLATPRWQSVDCGNPESVTLGAGSYVLKPAESSGSKGTFIVDAASFAPRTAQTRLFCFDDRAIVEEFIEGPQGTVEGAWRGREFELAVFTDRMTAPAPYVATTGHLTPSGISADHQREILRQVGVIFGHLSVGDCTFDCDFVIGSRGPYLIELTPRLGGNSISKLLMAATGVDLVSIAIWFSLSPEARAAFHSISTKPTRDIPAAIVILGADRGGLLQFDAAGLAELRELNWVEEITLDVPQGASISQFINGRERIGEVLITGTSQELNERVTYVRKRLAISATPLP